MCVYDMRVMWVYQQCLSLVAGMRKSLALSVSVYEEDKTWRVKNRSFSFRTPALHQSTS